MTWDGIAVTSTPRLILRTYRQDDLPVFAVLNADPEVYKTLSGQPLSRQHSDGIAEWAEECYALEGLALLAVERQSDGAFIGMCGLHRQETYPDEFEVGWRLAQKYWGNGYATEAAKGWLSYGFNVKHLPRVISMTDHDNVRSLAVMARLGMHFDHEAKVIDDGQTFDAVVYAITADQFYQQQVEPKHLNQTSSDE